jgi:ferric-dicitrate binding protein FerR (iron transport regulator)
MDPREADRICERLGDLAASAAPTEQRQPDASQWAGIGEKLDGRSRRARWLWPAMAAASLVLLVGGWMFARRPLDYRVQGCTNVDRGADCSITRGDIAFSDGTRVALNAHTRMRIEPLAFARGAELFLDDGRSTFAVVHRTRARWAVNAGPFRVAVTGTEFSVDWSKARGTIEVEVTRGEVHVSGGTLRETVLRAGQSINAALAEPARPASLPPATRSATPTASTNGATTIESAAHSRVPHGTRSARGARAASPTKVATSAEAPTPPPINEAPLAPRPGSALAFSNRSDEQVGESDTPAPAKPVTKVVLGRDGRLAGAMTGMTWVSRGAGTNLSAPITNESFTRLVPDGNGLCVSGTVAGLRCVNENSPKVRCNWDRNWGVSIGFDVKPGKDGWGADAPKSIAVEFHGRSAGYRLNAHRHGDPSERHFCVENYRSGQPVTPSMFKTRCWEDAGDTLKDFTDVDVFNLQFSSGMEYVAFHYCISDIRVNR